MRTIRTVAFLSLLTFLPMISSAQYDVYKEFDDFVVCGYQKEQYNDNSIGLDYLSQAISKTGECRTGDIIEKGRGVAICGDNGYSNSLSTTIDAKLIKALSKNQKTGKRFTDITFNSKGQYVIILNGTEYDEHKIPNGFKKRLEECVSEGDTIYSVSLDDYNNWAYVTDKHYGASSTADFNFMKKASEELGGIVSVCIAPHGIVVCCNKGVCFNNVPKSVADALVEFVELGSIPRVVKFTDSGTYLITDGKSIFSYWM